MGSKRTAVSPLSEAFDPFDPRVRPPDRFHCGAKRAGEPRRCLVRRGRGCSGATSPVDIQSPLRQVSTHSLKGTLRTGTPPPADAGASEVPPPASLREGTANSETPVALAASNAEAKGSRTRLAEPWHDFDRRPSLRRFPRGNTGPQSQHVTPRPSSPSKTPPKPCGTAAKSAPIGSECVAPWHWSPYPE